MRTKPYLGDKPWFGPRRFALSWGWAPSSWEGWVATAVLVAAILVVHDNPLITMGVVVLFLGVCALTGTSPGGRKEWQHFQNVRHREKLIHGGGDDTTHLRDVTENFDRRDGQGSE